LIEVKPHKAQCLYVVNVHSEQTKRKAQSMKRTENKTAVIILSLTALMFVIPNYALAHCDTMDGPVVKAAQKALAERNVNLVLLWVHKPDEAAIKEAFDRTLVVRELGGKARELADQYFFETLVRIHRASEGAPFTGLKPAGTDLEPVIQEADKALDNGSAEKLIRLVSDKAADGIRMRFAQAQEKKAHAGHNVEAGREFVAAYVEYVHYAEGLHQAAERAGAHHAEGPDAVPAKADHQESLPQHSH
jgi:hypothetical protein